ncbi:MAG: bifunctional [glutamate--ammonia ligase]-adenylyl-L-tyrosine phosphorylase/[glutamate--ammonia-ligase] adenylyltransferase [Chromatiales bacterium]|nr:bifunctional [glutamate--ammonia ligase]-adenylyl-L-tyrosine phosphorylase/[glutamate--ammonia-ligase] adenylyltransferase [Chromatiales bacterium]
MNVALHWERYCENAERVGIVPPERGPLFDSLIHVWAYSEFVAKACARRPEMLAELLQSGDLLVDYDSDRHRIGLRRRLRDLQNPQQLARELRRFREREMVRIAWRDIAGWAEVEETLVDVSRLAEVCVDEALGLLQAWQEQHWGRPRDARGNVLHLLVIGMGKLGAYELNFSSDIDLIFAFPGSGDTDGPRSISNEEFFTRVARDLMDTIGSTTADGFVFRVDARLRPFGDSGPLVLSFGAMEDYYQSQAREWERYAMVKARPISGEPQDRKRLMDTLRPFVYRRYLDFGAFESLREMKAMIVQELERRDMGDNVKLGLGGIREIEFIGQAFQLIRGGRVPELRERSILAILARLPRLGLLPEYASQQLIGAYRFLRLTENRLQQWRDRQTHILPEDPVARRRLAASLGFPDWKTFQRALNHHRERVHAQFDQVFAAPQENADAAQDGLAAAWAAPVGDAAAIGVLQRAGFTEGAAVLGQLENLRSSHISRAMSAVGQARLDRLMPLLLGAVAATAHPDETLRRVLGLVEHILRRSSYLALLADNPLALSQLVRLSDASPWIVRLLTRYPLLLDELLDPRTLYAEPSRAEREAELALLLQRLDDDDLEQQMERLRQFAKGNALRVAAAEITEVLPLMKVSDQLSEIAEVVLVEALGLAWQQLEKRHGSPRCQGYTPGMAVLAYGKLGGLELGYGSDLDLVFIHDSQGADAYTDGAKPIPNEVFFARLGQRIIHLLETPTAAGMAYEVDMRLRPNGNAGALVASLDTFDRYQHSEAWTWEHQALVRARVVAGKPTLGERIEAVRQDVLSQPREAGELRQKVVEMREKMRAELGSRKPGVFHLKQDEGGIADIEFMVQYGALLWAWKYPSLIRYTDNIRILEALASAGLMSPQDSLDLADAYRAFRGAVHRNSLQELPGEVAESALADQRDKVRKIWSRWMADGETTA